MAVCGKRIFMEFILFGFTLLGIAIFHDHPLKVGLSGLFAIIVYKLLFGSFNGELGGSGLHHHLVHEWVTLANLLGLLTGFALLARHFEKSHIPQILPNYLPSGWFGAFVLLIMIFVLSGFLDNIAAALIGGTMAYQLFNKRVHIAYLAGIVAASNAGGAGSVVGDTTTTMMWISGVSPIDVLPAYIGASVALVVFGIPMAIVQSRYSPILRDSEPNVFVDKRRLFIVFAMLLAAISTNILTNLYIPEKIHLFPFMGASVWIVIAASALIVRHDWEIMPAATLGAVFLLSLVLCASMMPVEKLPAPSELSVLGLGFLSSVFDNIPLTALAIKQGGYDWGLLAYAVGFGGSMMWFGSSAGIALSGIYPEMKSAAKWLRHGWYLIPAYLMGFAALSLILGWGA
ncbi:MAG: citrate transporter [Moraxellaceae bacterium]|nr:MAG: citrate transporter [Moraxellaceae bacterium]